MRTSLSRRHLINFLRLGIILLTLLANAPAGPNESALDLNGDPLNPFAAARGKAVALIFVRKDCPISGRYAPTIQELSARYRGNARFFLVFPDKTDSPEEISKYLHDFGYSLTALRDPGHALVREAHAQVTPEAAVFDAKGKLVYHGRIDNLYEDVSRPRPAATTHELDAALQSAIDGTPLVARETSAVGCYIADIR